MLRPIIQFIFRIYFAIRFHYYTFWHHPTPQPLPQLPPPLAEDVYKSKRRDRFLSWFHGTTATREENDSNVEKTFLESTYAEYWKEVKVPDNDLEKNWRRRVLMEATPQGTVVMYYDAFKRGFAYHSDAHMPYGLLNAAAMKYVMMFRCGAFFVDEEYFKEGQTSPLIRLEREQDECDDSNKKETNKNQNNKSKMKKLDGPFLKHAVPLPTLSSAFIAQKTTINPNKKMTMQEIIDATIAQQRQQLEEEKKSKKELHKNRFINLGKIVNFSMVQKYPVSKEKAAAKTAVPAMNFSPTMNYKEYKFWQREKESGSAMDVFGDMMK